MIAALRRVLAGAVVGALAAAGLALATPAVADAPAGPVAACVWSDELHDTIRDLGSDPARWSVVPHDEVPHGYGAYVDYSRGSVVVGDGLPCDTVADVVRHEWMHVQQVRMHGGADGIRRALGDRDEIVADCGSWILGSSYTPYRDRARADRGVACTSRDIADALELIGYPSWAASRDAR